MSQALSIIQQSVPDEVRPLLKRQYESWQQGTRVPVETMILAAKPEHRAIAAQALIKQEIVLREQSGENPSINEYRSRFPEYTDKLSRDWESAHEVTMVSLPAGELPQKRDSQLDTNHEVYEKTLVSHPGANDSRSSNSRSDGGRTMPSVEVGEPVDEMIGPYRLTKKLGQGGMGAVYQATHTKLDKVVAIKLLSRQSGLEATAVERFEREMKAVGKLDHPHIVRAMDAGECDGFHYLVMEYVEGRDVSQWVKARGPFPVGQSCEIIRQAALGLHEAHSLGLVHRDIKPSNLFLTSKGVIKILDLGLARLAEGTFNHELTQSGQCMGTPDYMAPEQWTNARDVDGRTDLYALGCTLYHVLAGRPPFGTSEHESLGSKVLAHTSGAIPDIRQLRADLPEPVRQILECLLAKDRGQRFATGADLAAALQSFCQPLPGADALSASQIAATPSISGMRIPKSKKKISRNRIAIFGVGFTMLALAAAFIVIRVRDKYGRVTDISVPAGSSVEVIHTTDNSTTPSNTAQKTAQNNKTGKKLQQDLASVTVRPVPAGELPEMQSDKGGTEPTVATTAPVAGDKGTVPAAALAVTDKPGAPAVDPKGEKPMPTVVAATEVPKDEPVVEKLVPPVPLRLPMAADLIAKQQGAWSRRMERPTTQANSIGITMVVIPPGEFDMGSSPEEQAGIPAGGGAAVSLPQLLTSEGPRHHVRISRPFAVGQTEVTVGQFREFIAATQYKTLAERDTATGHSLGEGITQKQRGRQPTFSWQYAGDIALNDEQPVCNLSWYDAIAFCEWLSQKEKATYRLPTEAEWEYIARAGLGTTAVGSDEWNDLLKHGANLADASAVRDFATLHFDGAAADWDDTFASVAPIGKFSPNVLGLQDLVGNVAEFCGDRFGAEYYQASPLENPLGPDVGVSRVVRGASWQAGLNECRPGMRAFISPSQAQMQVGFRIVEELQEPVAEGTVPPADTPARRELQIAEKVLSWGGKVRVAFGPQPSNEMSKATELPKRDFTVYSISLADTGISDMSLLRLKGLVNLQELDLAGTAVTDLGLETVGSFKSLRKLNLQGTYVTGAGLVHLVGAKKLADLDLSRCPVKDASLDPVRGLVSINALRLNSTAVTDAGLEALKPLVNLKELYLADTRITGSGLTNLKRMEQLTVLDLSLTPINNKTMQAIGELKKLRHLHLNWSTVGDLGVANLKDNYVLNDVGLRGTDVTDFNIEMLGKLRGIKSLDLRETDVTPSGVEELKKTLKATKIECTNGDFNARVASLCLSIGGQVTISNEGDSETKTLTDLKDLPSSHFLVREIQLTNLPVSDGWLWMVPKLQALKVLRLNGTRIDDAGLEVLANAKKLESLSLDGTCISEAGLEHLAALKQLKTLSLRDTRVPATQVTGLRQKLPTTEIQ
ncbi:MAG: SUMF1/EgtB/PvdO family nonheme iron enzyme [Planctomycetota bacterium]